MTSRLPLCVLVALATALGACSSFDEDTSPAGDAAVGPPVTPELDASVPDGAGPLDTGPPTPSGTPKLLTTATGQLGAFAAGGAGVAWTISDKVYGMAPGQVPVEMYSSPNTLSGFIVVSATHAYFTRDDGVIACPFGKACGADHGTLDLQKPGALALNAGTLFIAERAGQRRLLACSASGCTNVALVVPTLLIDPLWLAPAVSRIAVGYAGGAVVAHSPAGGSPPDALVDAKGLTGLVNDGVDAYWLEATTGKLGRRALLPTTATVDVKVGLGAPRDLVLEGNTLYWLETTSGSVQRCTKPACTDATIVAQLAGATRFALGDRVYIANDATGGIYAAPHP